MIAWLQQSGCKALERKETPLKALVYRGPEKMVVEEVEDPRLQAPTDAIVKVTSAAICGSDLHMYEGRTTVETGKIFGHEILGVIDQAGDAVTQLKVGDRVVLPFNISCGCCFNCSRGYTNACLTLNPEGVGAGYGYAGMGPFQGGQAQYVRVPYVEFNALKLPPALGSEQEEDDFLMLADILPTAYHATELAQVKTGMSVAIYGAGPVGLLAALSCQLKGAGEIYVVDDVPERLKLVEQIGAIPIDFRQGSPVEQIKERRKSNRRLQEAMRPGEEKMAGVSCGIDAVGYQCCSESQPHQEQATQIIDDLAQLVNPTGSVGIIGVFFPQDPGGVDPHAKKGEYYIPWGQLWEKGIKIGTGQCPVKKYNYLLRDLILAGKANPGLIVSHHLPLEAASEAYAKFDKRVDGYTKIVLQPND
jgi:glutathione-independent formaldehyde dehydrogenase